MFDTGGLFLLVAPNGGKWWRFKYRFADKEKFPSLGVYPDISLKDARDRRDLVRKKLATKIDPAANRKAVKTAWAANQANSFEVVAREWVHERVTIDPTDFGGKPEEREFIAYMHKTKKGLPSGLTIDATQPLEQVVDDILVHIQKQSSDTSFTVSQALQPPKLLTCLNALSHSVWGFFCF